MISASRIHLLLASLMGASGVALWAVAAHRGGPNAVTAAQMLLFHAAAIPALTACRKQGLLHSRVASIAIAGLVLGAVMFAGDLALRSFLGIGLFPMAAPAGGLLLILAWLIAALAALVRQG